MTQFRGLKRARLQIQESASEEAPTQADIDQTDRALLNDFDKALTRRNKTGDRQHAKHLLNMRKIAEHREPPVIIDDPEEPTYHGVALEDTLEHREASEKILDWINNRTYQGDPINEKTRTHLRGAVRMFGRLLTDAGPRGDEIPHSMATIPGGDPRPESEKDPTPRPNDIMWWDPDIIRILDHSDISMRSKAMIAVAWDSGGRPNEIKQLRWNQVSEINGLYRISLGSKDHPEHDPILSVSTPYLRKWLHSHHPANNRKDGFNPDTPIWSHFDRSKMLSMSTITQRIQKVREDLDLSKPMTFRLLRKSRASILATRPDIGRRDLENRLGWEAGSDMVGYYVARFGNTTDAIIAEGDGIPEGILSRETDDREPPAPVRCPNCERFTPRHLDDCFFCFTEFSSEDAETGTGKRARKQDARHREMKNEFLQAVMNDNVDFEALHPAIRFGRLLDGNDKIIEILEEYHSNPAKESDSIELYTKLMEELN